MTYYTSHTVGDIQHHLQLCLGVLQDFDWLVDSYILDFFTENHWQRLPSSWRKTLDELNVEDLGRWLLRSGGEHRTVFPLSLLCLREACNVLSLTRKPLNETGPLIQFFKKASLEVTHDPFTFGDPGLELIPAAGQHRNLGHIFRKHVKPKKQHEIARLARVCSMLAAATKCDAAVDVGAGVGHLSRLLNYAHGLQMFCLEAVPDFTSSADKFDEELEKYYLKRSLALPAKPRHVTLRLTPTTDTSVFTRTIQESTGRTSDSSLLHGVIGLHTCGDLAPILIRLFTRTPTMKFLVSVGCCYMKMDQSKPATDRCYPMSDYVKKLPHATLSYEALEVGCHAVETYCDRLLSNEETNKLKVHCYRAILETFLARLEPPVRRAGLRSVKNAHKLTFQEYASKALDRLDLPLNLDQLELDSGEIQNRLAEWKRVVSFYSLRLLLAPLVETAVLLDRLLFLHEQGYSACLVPLFDPRLSPRNSVLIAVKKD